MNQEIIDLYDEYTHKPLSRPEFMSRLAILTGGMAAALSILPMIEVNAAKANITAEDDLEIETITYEGVNGIMSAYVAKPKGKKKLAEESLQNFIRAFTYLSTRKDCNGQMGCVGFCWGGAMANNLAVNVPNLKAAVAYYGRQPEATKVAQIKSAVMLHYGGLDTRVNEGIPAYEAALKENKINYELFIYENVNHAFHNDTAGARYNEAAAKLSWERTLGFFAKYLK
jgi:carboxymethylenebutenolidase